MTTDNNTPQFVTRDNPANWVPVTTLRVGDLVVTGPASAEQKAAGAAGGRLGVVTELYSTGPASKRRWWVFADGKLMYPRGVSSRFHELVVR